MLTLEKSQMARIAALAISVSLSSAMASATTFFADGSATGYATVEFEMPDFVSYTVTGDVEASVMPFHPFAPSYDDLIVGMSRSATYDMPNSPTTASGAGTVTLTNTSSVEDAIVRSASEVFSDIYAEGKIGYLGTMTATGSFDVSVETDVPPGSLFGSIGIEQSFSEVIVCDEFRLEADACGGGDGRSNGNSLFDEWVLAPGESRTWTLNLDQQVQTLLDPAPTTVVPLPAPALLLGMTILGGLTLRRRK